jgi:tetratricopeptide (TPR) repeat protein
MGRSLRATAAGVAAAAAFAGPVHGGGNRPASAAVDPVCTRAAALADAGEVAAAKKLYVGLASKKAAPCATKALTQLNGDTAGDDLIAAVTRWGKLVGAALAVLLATVLAFVVAYVVASWTPLRHLLGRALWVGRLFDPSLKVEPFSDTGADPAVGAGVTGLVRTALARLGEEQTEAGALLVDKAAGLESVKTAISGLGDLAPQAKGVISLLTALPALARTPRYSVEGTLQLAGVAGDGLTVVLKERGDLAETTTLWWPPPAVAKSPDSYYQLATAAAAWSDYLIRKREDLDVPDVTRDATSFGYFHTAVELDRAGRTEDAESAYAVALQHDEDNVGALVNLGLIEAREEQYEAALVLFLRAVSVVQAAQP